MLQPAYKTLELHVLRSLDEIQLTPGDKGGEKPIQNKIHAYQKVNMLYNQGNMILEETLDNTQKKDVKETMAKMRSQ